MCTKRSRPFAALRVESAQKREIQWYHMLGGIVAQYKSGLVIVHAVFSHHPQPKLGANRENGQHSNYRRKSS